jgi:hypothetical protein
MTTGSDLPFSFNSYENKKTSTAAFTPDQLDRMRAMLDDPAVSPEHKNNFLYVLSDAGRLSNDDIDKYAPQVGANAADVKGGGGVDSNVDHAKTALAAAAGDQRAAAVKSDQSALQAASNAVNQGGYSNSDQIVDEGVKGLKLFDDFYPCYQKAGGFDAGAPSGGNQAPISSVPTTAAAGGAAPAAYSHSGVDPNSLRSGMSEFRGIDFTAFHADIQTLTAARATVDDSANALSTAWGKTADWAGAAKTAAESMNSLIVGGSTALSQSLKGASDVLAKTIDPSVMVNVERFCQYVIGLYGDGKIAGMSTADVNNALVTKDALPAIIGRLPTGDGMDQLISALPVLESIPPAANLFASSVGMTPGFAADGWQKVLDSANTKLQQFVTEYSTKANSVHQQAAVFVTATDKLYTQMIQVMTQGLDPDPFEPVPDTGGGQTTPSSSGGDSGSTGGGSTGGSPSPGGGDLPPTPAPPPVVAPPPPKTQDGMNPVTGQPLETDPATGQPYPIDPKTGAAIKDTGDGQESVKVQKGDNTIAMSEPDKDGKMDVAVDDGAGHQKDYKLDFGDDKTGATPDGAVEAKVDHSPPAPAAAGASGDFGPQGAKDGAPGADGTYKPGADGKIHIQDGDLKITAERPDGPGGPTVVTVDDGKGDPTAYTLDDKPADEVKAEPVTDATTGAHRVDSAPQDVSGNHHATPADGGTGTPAAAAATPDAGSSTAHETVSESAAAQPASAAYTAPGGLDLQGDLGTSAGHDPGSAEGDVTTPSSESTTPAGVDALGSALSAPEHESPMNSSLAAAFNLESGVHVGSEESLPAASDPHSELGVAPGGMDPAGGQAAAAAPPGGMAGMMGGMGGGGGGGGGEQQRSSSPYRVDGGIFETSGARGRISGSLDEDEGDRSISFGK